MNVRMKIKLKFCIKFINENTNLAWMDPCRLASSAAQEHCLEAEIRLYLIFLVVNKTKTYIV